LNFTDTVLQRRQQALKPILYGLGDGFLAEFVFG